MNEYFRKNMELAEAIIFLFDAMWDAFLDVLKKK
jgi:hypothetical protein